MPPSVNAPPYLDTSTESQGLALKTYSGVFNETFRNVPKLFKRGLPVVHEKLAVGSKSYQNLMMADTPDAEGEYDPGNKLMGQDYAVDESVVTRDKYIIAHHWIKRDEMRTAHFDILPRLAKADARKVGMEGDRRLFVTGALAARAASVSKNSLNVHNGGNRVTRTGGTVAAAYPRSATGAANFRADLRQLARQLDEDNVPAEGRMLWTTPYMLEVLLYDTTNTLFSKDFVSEQIGNIITKREVRVVEGFKLMDTVNTTTNSGSMPDSNITTGPTKFQADFSVGASNGTPVALVLCETADGGAPISMGTWEAIENVVHYDPTRMAWFVASFILTGIGQMNPWGAGSIEVIT